MKTFDFTIIASGLNPNADDFEDLFFEAGCDDATISFTRGAILIEFSRGSKNLSHAIHSAIRDVRSAGAIVNSVEPGYLVNITEIADRSGLTKQAISLYTNGKRSSGFPSPVAKVSSESPLWNWIDVAKWLHERKKIEAMAVVQARIVMMANDNLANNGHNVFA